MSQKIGIGAGNGNSGLGSNVNVAIDSEGEGMQNLIFIDAAGLPQIGRFGQVALFTVDIASGLKWFDAEGTELTAASHGDIAMWSDGAWRKKTALSPAAGHITNLIAGAGLTKTTDADGSITLSARSATSIAAGIARIATDAEAAAGVLETVFVNPKQLGAHLSAGDKLADRAAVWKGGNDTVITPRGLLDFGPGLYLNPIHTPNYIETKKVTDAHNRHWGVWSYSLWDSNALNYDYDAPDSNTNPAGRVAVRRLDAQSQHGGEGGLDGFYEIVLPRASLVTSGVDPARLDNKFPLFTLAPGDILYLNGLNEEGDAYFRINDIDTIENNNNFVAYIATAVGDVGDWLTSPPSGTEVEIFRSSISDTLSYFISNIIEDGDYTSVSRRENTHKVKINLSGQPVEYWEEIKAGSYTIKEGTVIRDSKDRIFTVKKDITVSNTTVRSSTPGDFDGAGREFFESTHLNDVTLIVKNGERYFIFGLKNDGNYREGVIYLTLDVENDKGKMGWLVDEAGMAVLGKHDTPAWVSGHSYSVGDYVAYNSVWYRCKTAHNSGTGNAPPGSHWEAYGGVDPTEAGTYVRKNMWTGSFPHVYVGDGTVRPNSLDAGTDSKKSAFRGALNIDDEIEVGSTIFLENEDDNTWIDILTSVPADAVVHISLMTTSNVTYDSNRIYGEGRSYTRKFSSIPSGNAYNVMLFDSAEFNLRVRRNNTTLQFYIHDADSSKSMGETELNAYILSNRSS